MKKWNSDMRKRENKLVLYGMDAVIILLALLCFAGGFIMVDTWHERDGARQSANQMLTRVLDKDYTRCLYYTYQDENGNFKENADLEEVYALSHYFEGAFYERVYRRAMSQTEGKAYEEAADKVVYYEQLQKQSLVGMGELAPVSGKIDRILVDRAVTK